MPRPTRSAISRPSRRAYRRALETPRVGQPEVRLLPATSTTVKAPDFVAIGGAARTARPARGGQLGFARRAATCTHGPLLLPGSGRREPVVRGRGRPPAGLRPRGRQLHPRQPGTQPHRSPADGARGPAHRVGGRHVPRHRPSHRPGATGHRPFPEHVPAHLTVGDLRRASSRGAGRHGAAQLPPALCQRGAVPRRTRLRGRPARRRCRCLA